MDQSPSEMIIQPKSLEKAQSELGTRIKSTKCTGRNMKHNLLSVSQMCVIKLDSQKCEIRREG
jgi:hypothetical protein